MSKTDPQKNPDIAFDNIRFDEPHEEISAKDSEVPDLKSKTSHLTNHGKMFNVSGAINNAAKEEGTIVSDRRHHRPSLGENLIDAFSEWTYNAKRKFGFYTLTSKNKEPVNSVQQKSFDTTKPNKTPEVVTSHTSPKQQTSTGTIKYVRTFKKDFEMASKTPPKNNISKQKPPVTKFVPKKVTSIPKPESKKPTPKETPVILPKPESEKPAAEETRAIPPKPESKKLEPKPDLQKSVPVAPPEPPRSNVAPLVTEKIQKPISDYLPKADPDKKGVAEKKDTIQSPVVHADPIPVMENIAAPIVTKSTPPQDKTKVSNETFVNKNDVDFLQQPKDVDSPKQRVQEELEHGASGNRKLFTPSAIQKLSREISAPEPLKKTRWDSEMDAKFKTVTIPDDSIPFLKGTEPSSKKPDEIISPHETIVAPQQTIPPTLNERPVHETHPDTPERASLPLYKVDAFTKKVQTPVSQQESSAIQPPQSTPLANISREPVDLPTSVRPASQNYTEFHGVPVSPLAKQSVPPAKPLTPPTVPQQPVTAAKTPKGSTSKLHVIALGGSALAVMLLLIVFVLVVWNGRGNDAPPVSEERYNLPVSNFIETQNQSTILLDGPLSTFSADFNTLVRQADKNVAVTEIVPIVLRGGDGALATMPELFAYLEANVPASLIKVLTNDYMIGAVQGDRSERFLMLRSYNFDVFFTSMLAWERTLAKDVAPLFDNIESEDSVFKDAVRGNASTRILYDMNGNEMLLYSFVNKNTVVITTSSNALSILISEL